MPSGLPKIETSSTTWYECADCADRFLGWKVKKRKYCGACVGRHCNGGGDVREGYKRRYGDDWEKHYDVWRLGQSKRTSGANNPRFGKSMSEEGKLKVAARTKGKTFVELYGNDEAARIKRAQSLPGELNPAFGKVYARGGRSVKGCYKGFFFRSLLEYSFMKHLERKGFDLARDVRYERFRVPYSFEGRNRTYTVDFYVIPEKIVYEVKPRYVAAKPPAEQLSKWEAARMWLADRGLEFKVVTEDDFEKLLFKDVHGVDAEVEWDERTFSYFKATHRDP